MAELALAIAGIAVPVFKHTIAAIHFIIDVKEYPESQAHLRLSLRIEEKRFQTWGELLGLAVLGDEDETKTVTDSLVFGPQRGLVVDLLAQMQLLFDNFRKHQTPKGKDIGKRPHGASDEWKEQSSQEAGEINHKTRLLVKNAVKSLSSASKESWDRIRWASWDMNEFEKLIRQFKSLNESMASLTDSKVQKQIADTTDETYRIVVQMAGSINELKRFVDATQSYGRQQGQVTTYQELAKFKAFNKFISDDTLDDDRVLKTLTGSKESIRRDLVVSEKSITIFGQGKQDTLKYIPQDPSASKSHRSRGEFRMDDSTRDVWIEWRTYKIGGPAAQDDKPPANVADSVKKLAQLLNHTGNPMEFRVPHCLGYFNNEANGRFGFVFEPPKGAAISALPKTLLQLIQDTADKTMRRPGITKRVELGKALTSSLLYLHTADWLHKALRSDNILFIPTQKTGQVDLTKPTLSGFEVARLIAKADLTVTAESDVEARMFRHPHSLDSHKSNDRKQYCKTFDIYSLGVVLIEIALWKPINDVLIQFDEEKMMKKHPTFSTYNEKDQQKTRREEVWDKKWARHRPARQKAIRGKLLQDPVLDAIGEEMGPLYMDVVKRCLTGGEEFDVQPGEEESTPIVAAKVGEAYYKKVVTRLEEIRL